MKVKEIAPCLFVSHEEIYEFVLILPQRNYFLHCHSNDTVILVNLTTGSSKCRIFYCYKLTRVFGSLLF